ncbi:MAG: ABC transporter substrate-binding protein [Acidobacteria bacterium]|nr:ABC transporter substrate-binding protein [Acidobacteriota bacterium]
MTTRSIFIWLLSLLAVSCRSGERIVVGSKNFTEQIILGELLAQHIENETGLPVERKLNLGGTFLCHQALLSGEVDVYVEYTGTALTAILKKTPLTDPEKVLSEVRSAYAPWDIEWLDPLGFNNSFAIIVRGSDARRLHIETISDASRFTPQWRAGFGYEFIERADGLKGLSQTYRLVFREPSKVMELGLIYKALADGQVDLIAGDTTSGLISALDLVVLTDDRHYFPPYQAVPLIRKDTLSKYPALRPALERLRGILNENLMRELNFAVDGRKQPVETVVRSLLSRQLNP